MTYQKILLIRMLQICAGLNVLLVSILAFASDAAETEFVIGPDYTNAPELTVRPEIPHGELHVLTMDSAASKIFPGIAKNQTGIVPYQRKVCVYIPKQYQPGTPAPFIVVQDGMGYTNLLPVVLDNMINDHRVPVMIAVMINSGGGDAQGSERGLEYDTLSDQYANFVETEVLPKISQDCQLTFTKDPEGRATMGCSSGAADRIRSTTFCIASRCQPAVNTSSAAGCAARMRRSSGSKSGWNFCGVCGHRKKRQPGGRP